MWRSGSSRLLLVLLSCLGLASQARSAPEVLERPAVARPVLKLGQASVRPGTVFFLAHPGEPGAVAVGAAHSFDLDQLREAGEVQFVLGRSEQRVSVASRFLVEPGRPFHAAGGSLEQDFVVFALDLAPRHVRTLPLAENAPAPGSRVRILGIPKVIPQDEDDVFGRVSRVEDGRIEVELDVPVDLRGWGGAPVLEHPGGAAIGMLQAAMPRDQGLAVVVSPLASVRRALARPLDEGRGRPFASFASVRPAQRPSTATAEDARERRVQPTPAPAPAPPPKQLLRGAAEDGTRIVLEIEHPADGAIVGSEAGAFVAGRAVALRGELRRFDVVLVLDTSASTKTMSGADINGNGVLGADRVGGLFGSTDPGDSILAAEVAAARQLLRGLDPRSTRVGLVTFAGEHGGGGGGGMITIGRRRLPPAITEEPLSHDYARIERSLDRVLARGPEGATHMAAGVDQATIELLGLRGALSEPDAESEKIALFLTDGHPTLPYDPIMESDNTRAVLRAADRARRAGLRIHSFAIGPEALDRPVAAVEMAERTNGHFTPVRQPGDLVDLIEEVSFANLEGLEVRNLTTGETSGILSIQPDGSWGALVPLAAGKNRIRVTARAGDGTEAQASLELQYAPGAPDPTLPSELLPRRTALLERRLVELRRARLETERGAAEQARKELLLEIEREREAARERAARQRKELELEATPDAE